MSDTVEWKVKVKVDGNCNGSTYDFGHLSVNREAGKRKHREERED